MNHTELGVLGERLANDYLHSKGYEIISRNFRSRGGEIDLIAETEKELIIVEVKTKHSAVVGEPWQAVTKRKQRQLIKMANEFVSKINSPKEVRFDIISIVHNSFRTDIEHIPNAFYPF